MWTFGLYPAVTYADFVMYASRGSHTPILIDLDPAGTFASQGLEVLSIRQSGISNGDFPFD